jgi:hypothetical protein
MTQVPAGLDAGQLEPCEPEPGDGPPRLGGYVALLRTPGAARFCVSGMIGRAPMSMFGLGTVLLVSAAPDATRWPAWYLAQARSDTLPPRRR